MPHADSTTISSWELQVSGRCCPEDLVTLLREELVQFCTADIVEVTPHGLQVLGRTKALSG